MSILVDKLRAVLFSNLRPDMPVPLRTVAWDLFTAIDQDLDIAGYNDSTVSSTTEEVIERFDHILKRNELPDLEVEVEEEEEVPEVSLEKKSFEIPDEDLE